MDTIGPLYRGTSKMEYGQSEHYEGEAGKRYFAYQNENGNLGGRLNATKFAPFVRSSDRVLDFGCGGGWLLRELSAAGKIGVELNPVARQQCVANGVAVVPEVQSVEGLVDVIVSNHCLEHVPYPIEALRQLRSKLKSGGRLVLVVPIDDWRSQRHYLPADLNHHLQTWTPLLMGHTLTEAGFKVDRIDVLTSAWPPRVAKLHAILPAWAFELACWAWAVLRRRRQLIAIAS
jgi:2-polyprenyl-3-methyl-5-hydroxy-6-metoxy-1,4-benzoquinol methylase